MQGRSLIKLLAGIGMVQLVAAQAVNAEEAIKVGVTNGPHAQILDVVKQVAARDGLTIKVIEFSDYAQPNAALAAFDLDANSFQHQPYLDAQVRAHGYKIVSVAKTVTSPMGLYSKKIKSLAELKPGARVSLPNDPTNGGRGLLLLQKQGLIKLRADAGLKATPLDVVDNSKKLKFVELDARQLPASLAEVDLAAINTNFAMEANLQPKRDAIVLEDPQGPYANVLVVREQDRNKPWVAKLVKAYHSTAVKGFIERQFHGSFVVAW
jgi:D-methionine transport system substrate-binding protein